MRQRRFMLLWTLAVVATAAAFVVHLALRGRTVDVGFQLGKARAEQARLRETKRVLELEVASYQTPHRVEQVARTLLAMTPPPPERVIPIQLAPKQQRKQEQKSSQGAGKSPDKATSN